MKRILSIILLFAFLSTNAQVYQEMPQYGYRANRMAFDSTLQIPTTCGIPTLKSVVSVNKKSAIAFDSCNNKLYSTTYVVYSTWYQGQDCNNWTLQGIYTHFLRLRFAVDSELIIFEFI